MRGRSMCVGLLLLVGAAAHAEDDAVERARNYFSLGLAHFKLGENEAAAKDFEAGYALAPLPLFLYNIGQAARHANQHQKALEFYQRYLEAEPQAPERAEVEGYITQLRAKIDAARAPAVVAAVQVSAAPPPRKSFIRRHWWIIPTVAVVAAGVGVGIYFGARAPSACDNVQSCIR